MCIDFAMMSATQYAAQLGSGSSNQDAQRLVMILKSLQQLLSSKYIEAGLCKDTISSEVVHMLTAVAYQVGAVAVRTGQHVPAVLRHLLQCLGCFINSLSTSSWVSF